MMLQDSEILKNDEKIMKMIVTLCAKNDTYFIDRKQHLMYYYNVELGTF